MNKEVCSTERKALTPLSGVVYNVILESGRKFFYIVYNFKQKIETQAVEYSDIEKWVVKSLKLFSRPMSSIIQQIQFV